MSLDRLREMGFDHYELGKTDPDYYLHHRETPDGKKSYKVLDRELRASIMTPSSFRFLLKLYGNRENYIYSDFNPAYRGYLYLEDVIHLYDSALVNTQSAYLVIKKLDGGYLDEVFDPAIAAHDLIDKVLTDKELFKKFTDIRFTF